MEIHTQPLPASAETDVNVIELDIALHIKWNRRQLMMAEHSESGLKRQQLTALNELTREIDKLQRRFLVFAGFTWSERAKVYGENDERGKSDLLSWWNGQVAS